MYILLLKKIYPQVFCLSLGVCAPPALCSSGGRKEPMGKRCKSGQASCNHLILRMIFFVRVHLITCFVKFIHLSWNIKLTDNITKKKAFI